MPYKDKEKAREYAKKWKLEHRELTRAYNRSWREGKRAFVFAAQLAALMQLGKEIKKTGDGQFSIP